MRNRFRPALIRFATLPALLSGGCGGNAPSLPSLQEISGTVSEAPIVGSPTEVYERIARGVLGCWFGAQGPLKAGYVYHAEADPPSQGGKAEITIHERDRLSSNPKGIKAYRIAIAPDDKGTTLLFENLKMPEPMAKGMESDARRWGGGGVGCTEVQAEGWSDNAPAPAPAPPKKGKAKQPAKGN